MVLRGTEVKSLRAGEVAFRDAFARIEAGEVFLHALHISPYEQGNRWNVDPDRVRKLLLQQIRNPKAYGQGRRKRSDARSARDLLRPPVGPRSISPWPEAGRRTTNGKSSRSANKSGTLIERGGRRDRPKRRGVDRTAWVDGHLLHWPDSSAPPVQTGHSHGCVRRPASGGRRRPTRWRSSGWSTIKASRPYPLDELERFGWTRGQPR